MKLSSALDRSPEMVRFFTMGFVRNPWERFHSWHSMIIRRQQGALKGTYDAELFARNEFWQRVAVDYPTFEGFVLEGINRLPRLRAAQVDYLEAPGRSADFIGRTERLESDLNRGLTLAGLPTTKTLDRTNAGPALDYRDHYTPAMRDRVAEVADRDIKKFGYAFSP